MKGVSLRQAAAELGVSRKKLLRLIRDGMPVERKGERVFVDLDVARDWLALGEMASGVAPVLHPDDPRYRAKLLAVRIEWLKFAIKAGHIIRRADAVARYSRDVTEFRTALLTVGNNFGPGEVPSREAIAEAFEDALATLTTDDPATWPDPRPVPPWPEDPAPIGENADVTFADQFSPSDPRHAFHVAKLAKLETEHDELQRQVLTRETLFRVAKEHLDSMRARIREIPDRIPDTDDEDEFFDRLDDEINSALADMSGEAAAEAA